MQSEFSNVALDCIRFSLVWEDNQTLYDAVHLFGLLTVIALVAALYAELIIFPLVLDRFDKKDYVKP